MDKLKHIMIGDEVTFPRSGQLVSDIVTGWVDRPYDGHWKKCLMLRDHPSIPVDEVVSRSRPGAGTIVFDEIAS